jgi:hypothetical protein
LRPRKSIAEKNERSGYKRDDDRDKGSDEFKKQFGIRDKDSDPDTQNDDPSTKKDRTDGGDTATNSADN